MRITLEVEDIDDLTKLEEWIIHDRDKIGFKNILLNTEFFTALSGMSCIVKFKQKEQQICPEQ